MIPVNRCHGLTLGHSALFVILGFRLLFRRHTKQVVTAQASEPRLSDEQKQRLQRLLQEKKE